MRGNNSVLYALDNLSRTVRGFGRDKSQHELGMANLGLQGARDEYNMGRQTRADARADELHESGAPGRKLKFGQDEAALADYNAPVTMSMIMSSPEAVEHFLHYRKGGDSKAIEGEDAIDPTATKVKNPIAGKANIDLFLKDMGWTYDKDGDMPIRTKSGDFLKKGEFPVESYEVWLKSNMDPKRRARGQRERNDLALRSGEITPQAHAANLAKISDYENSIQTQVAENANLIERLGSFDAPWAKKRIARLTDKNDALLKEDRARNAADKGVTAKTKAGLGTKDSRSSDEKLMDYYATHITGGDKAKAVEIFRTDKLMGQKLRVYAEELKAMQNSLNWMNLSTEEQKAAIDDLQIRLQIKPKSGLPPAPVGGRKELLPGQEKQDNPGWNKYDY